MTSRRETALATISASPAENAGGIGGTIEVVPCDALYNDPANVRKHGQRNLDAIKASLSRFGQQRPILANRDGVVIAGNGTLMAARALGWREIKVVRTELSGVEATAYAIADNRTAELAEWDDEALAAQMAAIAIDDDALAEACGFDAKELADLMPTPEVVEDEVPEPPENPITQRGDIWTLGRHRLMCGDSRIALDADTLFGGAKANIAITSPPYASQRKYDEESQFKPIQPDKYSAWWHSVQSVVSDHLSEDGSFFINIKEHCDEGSRALYVKDLVIAHVREWGWTFVDEFCWTHGGTPRAVVNRFKNGWEPIFHFTKGAHKFRPEAVMHETESAILGFKANRQVGKSGHPSEEAKQGKRFSREGMGGMAGRGDAVGAKAAGAVASGMAYPSNVLSLGKNREALGHSAAFPVSLPSFFIRAYTDENDIVYEPFCGSGTTLIAAEQLNRTCYGMEISPAYCDVIVKRWENLTGQKAVRNGR